MTELVLLLLGAALMLALVAMRARLASFAAQQPDDYAAQGPAFDMCHHLSGPLTMEGVIYGPTGRVVSHFHADAMGDWHGTSGTLAESFTYDTGTRQNREWALHLLPDGHINATAPDVIGTGLGRVSGNTVNLNYRIRLAPEAGGHVLSVTDWMYLTPNGVILNRSQFRKFGILVAELVATIRPAPAEMQAEVTRRMAAE